MMVTGTCLNKRIKRVEANGKEISVVSEENPYPGSNDRYREEVKTKEEGEKKRKKDSSPLSHSWFPSGDFIMASSYYCRTSSHGHDPML